MRLQIVMAPSQVKAIDAWRAKQPDLPSRSEANKLDMQATIQRLSNTLMRNTK